LLEQRFRLGGNRRISRERRSDRNRGPQRDRRLVAEWWFAGQRRFERKGRFDRKKETYAPRLSASIVARDSAAWRFRLFLRRSCDHGRFGWFLLVRGRQPRKWWFGKRREHQHGR
jgi:hypothetical protein